VRIELASHYYRRLSKAVLAKPTIAALLGALHDHYTTYLSPSEYRLARRAFAGGYGGIGITVLPAPGGLLVRGTMNGPARVAGVLPGDTIITVDGASASPLSFREAIGRILGRPGSTVTLRVLRDGRVLTFTLVRRKYRLHPVHARIEHGVGVIKLDSFARNSAAETATAVRRLEREGARGLVLDLRGNPGGLFTQAVSVSSLFLGHGIIVSMIGAHQPLRVLHAHPGVITKLPLVVLVDRYSASSAEIVAAALGDNHRATLIGQRTYGKALVQALDPLANGDALELTVAHYYTPRGADISSRGVVPQIHAVDDPRTPGDEALAVALNALARPIG